MQLQPITYHGRLLAVTATRFYLSDRLEHGDPVERSFVTFMCAYARDVINGQLPGPYSEQGARRYARYCLLAPGCRELLERPELDLPRTAHALGVPETEIRAALRADITDVARGVP